MTQSSGTASLTGQGVTPIKREASNPQTPQTLRPEQAAGHQTFQKQKPGPLVLEMMFRKP